MLSKTLTTISSWTDTFSTNSSSTATKTNTYQNIITEYKITVWAWRDRGLSFKFDDVTYTIAEATSWHGSSIWQTIDLSEYAIGAKTVIITSTYNGNVWNSNFTINYKLGKQQGKITWKPTTIRAIWELGSFNLYGVYNNDYIGGLMIKKDTTATTGSITLWNAKGYIKVLFNNEYIKIPYYGD